MQKQMHCKIYAAATIIFKFSVHLEVGLEKEGGRGFFYYTNQYMNGLVCKSWYTYKNFDREKYYSQVINSKKSNQKLLLDFP